jgi:hypothetical protein
VRNGSHAALAQLLDTPAIQINPPDGQALVLQALADNAANPAVADDDRVAARPFLVILDRQQR